MIRPIATRRANNLSNLWESVPPVTPRRQDQALDCTQPRADDGRERAQPEVFRSSLTRTALPCERGTSPCRFTAMSQVTPIIDLM
jgi:hypothetical protein